MGQFVRVASVDEIPLGTLKGFDMEYMQFVIAHTPEGFYAIVDECSHDSAQISGGELAGQEIVCPRHGARFNLKTGAVTAPPAITPIDTLRVKLEGNDLFVYLD